MLSCVSWKENFLVLFPFHRWVSRLQSQMAALRVLVSSVFQVLFIVHLTIFEHLLWVRERGFSLCVFKAFFQILDILQCT